MLGISFLAFLTLLKGLFFLVEKLALVLATWFSVFSFVLNSALLVLVGWTCSGWVNSGWMSSGWMNSDWMSSDWLDQLYLAERGPVLCLAPVQCSINSEHHASCSVKFNVLSA